MSVDQRTQHTYSLLLPLYSARSGLPSDPVNCQRMSIQNAVAEYDSVAETVSISFGTSTPSTCTCRAPALGQRKTGCESADLCINCWSMCLSKKPQAVHVCEMPLGTTSDLLLCLRLAHVTSSHPSMQTRHTLSGHLKSVQPSIALLTASTPLSMQVNQATCSPVLLVQYFLANLIELG